MKEDEMTMVVSIQSSGNIGPKKKYVAPIRVLLSTLFERAGIRHNIVINFAQQISAHGGSKQGMSGVRFKRAKGARGRRVTLTVQVAGNDSCYEFNLTTPQGVETEEFISKLEEARDALVREESEPRFPEVVMRVIEDFGKCADYFTSFEDLPSALTEVREGEYEVNRSIFHLLDDEKVSFLLKTCEETTILGRVLNMESGDISVHGFNKQMHRKIVAELSNQDLLVQKSEESSRSVDPVVVQPKKSPELEAAEELLRHATSRLEVEQQRTAEIEGRVTERAGHLTHQEGICRDESAKLDAAKGEVHSLQDRIAKTQEQLKAIERELQMLVSQRSVQQESVRQAKERAEHQRSVLEKLQTEQKDDETQLHRARKSLEISESEVRYAEEEYARAKQRPIDDLVEQARKHRLTAEQRRVLIAALEQDFEEDETTSS
jgi:hypothetical protein